MHFWVECRIASCCWLLVWQKRHSRNWRIWSSFPSICQKIRCLELKVSRRHRKVQFICADYGSFRSPEGAPFCQGEGDRNLCSSPAGALGPSPTFLWKSYIGGKDLTLRVALNANDPHSLASTWCKNLLSFYLWVLTVVNKSSVKVWCICWKNGHHGGRFTFTMKRNLRKKQIFLLCHEFHHLPERTGLIERI